MMRSKLPNSVLRRVWNLSDIDQDGMLDRDEFAVAMFLIDHKIAGNDIPDSLPGRLIPPSKAHLRMRSREDERRERTSDDFSGSQDGSYSQDSGYRRDASHRGGGGGGGYSFQGGGEGGRYEEDKSYGGRQSSSRGRHTEDDDSHLSSFIDRGQ